MREHKYVRIVAFITRKQRCFEAILERIFTLDKKEQEKIVQALNVKDQGASGALNFGLTNSILFVGNGGQQQVPVQGLTAEQ